MRYYPDETERDRLKNNAVFFYISDAQGYYPFLIPVNHRSTPEKERVFIDKPDIHITDGQLCIPPDIYFLPDASQEPYIVELVLQSKKNRPRNFVMRFELRERRVYNIHLTDMEITRPYNKMDKQ